MSITMNFESCMAIFSMSFAAIIWAMAWQMRGKKKGKQTMEKHCVSLELAKEMKKTGWKKKTEFWWFEDRQYVKFDSKKWKDDFAKDWGLMNFKITDDCISAPLATEILEELPPSIKTKYGHENRSVYIYLQIDKHHDIRKGYRCRYVPEFNPEAICWFQNEFIDISFPDVLAEMWIYLKKEKINAAD